MDIDRVAALPSFLPLAAKFGRASPPDPARPRASRRGDRGAGGDRKKRETLSISQHRPRPAAALARAAHRHPGEANRRGGPDSIDFCSYYVPFAKKWRLPLLHELDDLPCGREGPSRSHEPRSGSVPEPRVAAQRLPWVASAISNQPRRGCAQRAGACGADQARHHLRFDDRVEPQALVRRHGLEWDEWYLRERAPGRNPCGVDPCLSPLPRVAAARQPWAPGRNRFAVQPWSSLTRCKLSPWVGGPTRLAASRLTPTTASCACSA